MPLTIVILGGGLGRRFGVLTSRDLPKALLPVANAPLLSYPVDWVAASGLPEALIVAAGEAAAAAISRWVVEEYKGPCKLTVIAVAEDKGAAGALRAVSDRVKGGHVVVISGDIITDVPLASLLARHRTSAACATVLLAPRRPSLAPEVKLGRPPNGCDYVGLDSAGRTLCFTAASKDVRDVLRLPRSALRVGGGVALRCDLLDCQAYCLHASVLPILHARPAYTSVKRDLLPYLVRRQFDALPYAAPPLAPPSTPDGELGPMPSAPPGTPITPACAGGAGASGLASFKSSSSAALFSVFPEGDGAPGPAPGVRRMVAVLLAEPGAYCARCDSLRAYLEINRELASPGEGGHLTALPLDAGAYLAAGVELGAKAAVGAGCVVGWGSRLGDRVTLKRSVVGRRVRAGAGSKLVNCVVHDDCVLEEGAQLQGCVLGRGVTVGAGASLRDCQVAPGTHIAAGVEHRNEQLGGGRTARP